MSVSAINVQSDGLGSFIRRMMKEELDDLKSANFWRAVFAEFLGCLMLVLTGVGAGLHEENSPHPSSVHVILQAGFYIAVVISILGHVSGAHVNPALSAGFAVTRKISMARFVFYVIGQSAGAISGAALLKMLIPESMHGNFGLLTPSENVSPEQALVVEMIVTFILVFAVFALVDERRTDIGGSKPLIVGLVVCANIFFSVSITITTATTTTITTTNTAAAAATAATTSTTTTTTTTTIIIIILIIIIIITIIIIIINNTFIF